MADIDLRGLLDQKKQEFATQGAGDARFAQDFLNAVNRAIGQINRKADLETRITIVETIEDGVTGLDAKYEDVLSAGVSYHLLLIGRRPAKGAEPLLAFVRNEFYAGIDEIRVDIMNLAMDADTDQESDFIGQGAPGA